MRIVTAGDAARLLEPACRSGCGEVVALAFLDGGRRLLMLRQESGAADAADLPVRAILAQALRLDAAGMVLAHNHPSGDPTPSDADIAATRQLAAAGRAVGVRLWDHLIFGGRQCRSLRALGLL